MDFLTLAGLFIALGAIAAAQLLEGGQLMYLLSLPAFLIVMGGTLGAVLLQTPWSIFARSMRLIVWAIKPPKFSIQNSIEIVFELSRDSRKRGLLSLEEKLEQESNHFLRRALALVIDAHTPDEIRSALLIELESEEQIDLEAIKVFEGMGGYSPTIGILGTVLSLIKVMEDLTDPEKVGAGIAVAFVATIYGVGFANLLFLPVSHKLKNLILKRSRMNEMLIEGFVGIAEGENPHMLKTRLDGFVGKY
jgi:chemotaxis protein MotA